MTRLCRLLRESHAGRCFRQLLCDSSSTPGDASDSHSGAPRGPVWRRQTIRKPKRRIETRIALHQPHGPFDGAAPNQRFYSFGGFNCALVSRRDQLPLLEARKLHTAEHRGREGRGESQISKSREGLPRSPLNLSRSSASHLVRPPSTFSFSLAAAWAAARRAVSTR